MPDIIAANTTAIAATIGNIYASTPYIYEGITMCGFQDSPKRYFYTDINLEKENKELKMKLEKLQKEYDECLFK